MRRTQKHPKSVRSGSDGSGGEREEAPTRKNFNLYQSKIDLAKEILGTGTETEAIDQALDLVIFGEQLARGTMCARGRAFNDLFGEEKLSGSSLAER